MQMILYFEHFYKPFYILLMVSKFCRKNVYKQFLIESYNVNV